MKDEHRRLLESLGISEACLKAMIEAAGAAREYSYAPYSGFTVGAALLTESAIISGCNVENAAYSPGNCAERTAVFKAVSEGMRNFKAIAIVAGANKEEPVGYTSPCGVCRQVLREFVDPKTFPVIMAKNETDYIVMTLEELMPMSFGPDNLK